MRSTIEINKSVGKAILSSKSSYFNLIFPQIYQGKSKIREPEARYIYCNILEKIDNKFSIEVPTIKNYSFKGKNSRKALVDLVIYDSGLRINIEFKEGQPGQSQVDKDIEKLVREPANGVWFHVFQSRNTNAYHKRGTLESLIIKFNKALLKYTSNNKEWIQFCVVVREYREFWYLTKNKNKLSSISLNDFNN